MNVRDLIPWSRQNDRSLVQRDQTASPFLSLQRDMNRLFDDFWRDFDLPTTFSRTADWPQVDVVETDSEYKVTAELPGLEEKDVQLTLRDNALTISGERKSEHEDRNGGRFYAERFYGSFQRTIPFPTEVDGNKVAAAFKNGVLTVVLPKNAEAKDQGKRIPIQKLS